MSGPSSRRPSHGCLTRDRGAVIPFVAICLVLIVATAALAIDIGRVSVAGREARNVADLAALDAVRSLNGEPAAAQQAAIEGDVSRSAARNGFDEGVDGALVTTLGTYDRSTKVFTPSLPAEVPTAVNVAVRHPNDNLFAPGSFTVRRSATATADGGGLVGISVTASTAAVDANRSAILNAVLGNALGTGVALDVASWQTLVDAQVDLVDLAVVGLGLAPEQVDRLLDDVLSFEDLIAALDSTVVGGPAQSVLGSLVGLGSDPLSVRLADVVDADLDAPGAQLLALSVGDLIEAAAMASGLDAGQATIAVDLGGSAPALVGAAVELTIVHPAEFAFGSVGTVVRSAQTRLTVVVPVGDAAGVAVSLPLAIDTGRGAAEILAIDCGGSVEPDVVEVSGAAVTASVNLGTFDASGDVVAAPVLTLSAGSHLDVFVRNDPVEGGAVLAFDPPYRPDRSQQVSAAGGPVAVAPLTDAELTSVVVGPDLPEPTTDLLDSTKPAVVTQINAALADVLPSLLQSLAVDLGLADIAVTTATCQPVALAR